jgi:hypothetical protein
MWSRRVLGVVCLETAWGWSCADELTDGHGRVIVSRPPVLICLVHGIEVYYSNDAYVKVEKPHFDITICSSSPHHTPTKRSAKTLHNSHRLRKPVSLKRSTERDRIPHLQPRHPSPHEPIHPPSTRANPPRSTNMRSIMYGTKIRPTIWSSSVRGRKTWMTGHHATTPTTERCTTNKRDLSKMIHHIPRSTHNPIHNLSKHTAVFNRKRVVLRNVA